MKKLKWVGRIVKELYKYTSDKCRHLNMNDSKELL